MSLRFVFEREDLQRVRVAGVCDPMWELVLSLHQIREKRLAPRFVPWRQRTMARVRGERNASRWMATLCTLVPQEGSFSDFLTPAPVMTDLAAGCESVACTPATRLRADLEAVFEDRKPPGWVRELASGDRDQLTEVVSAINGAYELLVAPHLSEVSRAVTADRQNRVSVLARDGVGALLARLPGVLSWDGCVLEVVYPVERTVHLGGRGLTVVPSYFCDGKPVTLIDSDLPPILVYPIDGTSGAAAHDASAQLVALLSRTRADCLAALASPHSTSALAARLGTSVGTASKQAAILREAGLITSLRQGSSVLHHVTDLGAELLTGPLRAP